MNGAWYKLQESTDEEKPGPGFPRSGLIVGDGYVIRRASGSHRVMHHDVDESAPTRSRTN